MTRFAVTWMFVVTCAALAVFYVSQTVEGLERELALQQRTILQQQEAIHVLEAEWSYLNRPERISLLAERYLALSPCRLTMWSALKTCRSAWSPGAMTKFPGSPQRTTRDWPPKPHWPA